MRTRGFGGGGGGVFAGKEVEAADAEMALDDAGVASAATAQAAGELFEYVINTPVALERQHSAMLPIVTTDVEGTKLSIYNPGSHPKHPLNGLKLKNTTGLHLMQGPITVFDGNVYAGDAKLPDLRADEERLVAYALDLAVEVDAKAHPQPDDVTRLVIRKGSLIQTRRLVDDRTYTVKNKSAAARTVLIEQPYDKSWTFKEPEKPEEATPTLLRFKVEPPAKGNATLRVLLERPVDEHIVLSNLGQDQIVVYMRSRVISEAVKKALARLVELRTALDNTTRQIAQTNAEIEEVSNEQSRIRENMKTLSHNSEVYKRYEKKFDSQETEIEKRREQIAELRKTEQAQRNELEQFLLSLNVD
jgi:hypothetical protein